RWQDEALPWLDAVGLVSSGTESTISALRLARATTGRDLIVKFAGCYHGHVDALLVRAGSGPLTLGVPDSPGVPAALATLTLITEFHDTAGNRGAISRPGPAISAGTARRRRRPSGVARPCG